MKFALMYEIEMPGRVPHPKTMESIKLFGKYVIPYFKGRTSWNTAQVQKAAIAPADQPAQGSIAGG
jgi:hypothetical protein